jgi:uncharacterized protein YcfJ
MRKIIAIAALAATISLPLIVGPTEANASCQGRKETGTILGGVGGALLGNSVSRGGGGAVIGGLGGAVLGHEIAKSGCRGSRHAYYRSNRRDYYRSNSRDRYASTPPSNYGRRVYYDQYGNAVLSPSPYYR